MKHPNALVGGTAGSGGGALVVWILGMSGVQVEPEVAAVMAGLCAAITLAVGRHGLRGMARLIWRGREA